MRVSHWLPRCHFVIAFHPFEDLPEWAQWAGLRGAERQMLTWVWEVGWGRPFKLKIASFRAATVSGVGENGKGELNKIVVHLPYFFFTFALRGQLRKQMVCGD